ncbi:methyltransferase domain-containing protein [Paenibacillus aurantius]|uniref:Methyltransferase domain-containing protein n=1 Tax=Paenibacillus aurantius TaxID=2918900 RepID=A0AA96LFN8_9BACL|nr:methyltransferase domain-containing protein [Paenibacillus aurantius]WNQ12183.1 methyltransferase domain-containing protein [Paenibacillus aurantius]
MDKKNYDHFDLNNGCYFDLPFVQTQVQGALDNSIFNYFNSCIIGVYLLHIKPIRLVKRWVIMEFQKDLSHLGWEEVRNRQLQRMSLVSEWASIAGIKEGSTLLDIGPGPGAFLNEYASLVGTNGKVIALEKSKEAIDYFLKTSNQPNVITVCWNAEQPYNTEIHDIDVITLTDVLHHAESILDILKNVRTLSNVKTRILISKFDPETQGAFGPPLTSRIPISQLKSAILSIGFEVCREGKQDFEHYYLLLKTEPST